MRHPLRRCRNLALLLDALDGVADLRRRACLPGMAGFETHIVENIAAVITRARRTGVRRVALSRLSTEVSAPGSLPGASVGVCGERAVGVLPCPREVGQSDLQFHDLCPSVPCWPRSTGATLAELMARLRVLHARCRAALGI
jgi:hypothetical protein